MCYLRRVKLIQGKVYLYSHVGSNTITSMTGLHLAVLTCTQCTLEVYSMYSVRSIYVFDLFLFCYKFVCI
jgi:hypothetical protein